MKALIRDALFGGRTVHAQVKKEVLPSASNAAATMKYFQEYTLHGESLTAAQMDQMARTGTLTTKHGETIKVGLGVQEAAKRYMANDGLMFKMIESSTDGRRDGKLGINDYYSALGLGTIRTGDKKREVVITPQQMLPSASGAAKAIHDFQVFALGGKRITAAQMEQMARTGYITLSDGTIIPVSSDVQAAAKRFMANCGELFKKLESSGDGECDGQLEAGDYLEAIKKGTISASGRTVTTVAKGDHLLPAPSSAAKTIHDFQVNVMGGKRISGAQMQQMARTGYVTLSNGKSIRVPPEVQAAAQRFMANRGALFKKMESATDGDCDGMLEVGDYHAAHKRGKLFDDDGTTEIIATKPCCELPSASSAAATIHDFQISQLNGKRLTIAQMDQMANTGYLTTSDGKTIRVPPEVQAAAQRFMADDAQLFRKIESASDGKCDGLLRAGDFDEAMENGTISALGPKSEIVSTNDHRELPCASSAAKTIHDFQSSVLGGKPITAAQMDQMARTGFITLKDGKVMRVSPEVQKAAKRFMANCGELFAKMESACKGVCDGRLGVGDYHEAIKQGKISSEPGPTEIIVKKTETELPSASSAARLIHDFQVETLDSEQLSAAQMSEIAQTGYLTRADGSLIRVPPAIVAAAQRFMANGGELFKDIESASTGNCDGQLSVGDYDQAIANGTIPGCASPVSPAETSVEYVLPSASVAAKSIHDFQHSTLGGEMLSIAQIMEMAQTGYLTRSDGSVISVPPEVQAAAERLMANDADLFRQLESATTGTYDGLLSTGDYKCAVKNGVVPRVE